MFGGGAIPIFLVTVFAKNEKDNLSRAEQTELITLGKRLLCWRIMEIDHERV